MSRFLPALLFIAVLTPRVAAAQQIAESVGCRALGMAGAFVAVADDASAVYWNPAGLATGRFASATIEWADFRTRDQMGAPVAGASSRGTKFTSMGALPLGLSYIRQDQTIVTANGSALVAQSLRTAQYGLTLVQTVAPGIVVGATLKFVRGTTTSEPVSGVTAKDALDHGAAVAGKTSSAFDIDLGVMIDAEYVRAGLVVRNLRSPTFTDVAGIATTLKRHSRAGIAVLVPSGLTLAMDVDVDTAALVDGPRRMLAVGGEQRLGDRVAVRGGTRWNLAGDRNTVVAFGASVMIRARTWLDGQITRGGIAADRGFGIALRGAF